MSALVLDGVVLDPATPAGQAALAKAHSAKTRVGCACTRPPQPMYIARIEQTFFVKRMPNSGNRHHPECDSYEPPAELSGLGEVAGSAIVEDAGDGSTALKLDFALTKVSGRTAPVASGQEADTVRTDGKKLTLRGLLHYLWDQARFNRWSSAMAGKRSWGVIHKYLLQAASGKQTKQHALADLLLVPEAFVADRADAQHQHVRARLAPLMQTGKGPRRLMMVVGEVKAFDAARYGHKVTIKHLPKLPFMVSQDLHDRIRKRFADELALSEFDTGNRLILAGTFGVGPTGVSSLEEVALMVTTHDWLPIETVSDLELVNRLVAEDRRFIVGMRYNLAKDRPLASAVLLDTQPELTALYIVPVNASDAYMTALEELTTQSKMYSWYWSNGGDSMPALPAFRDVASMPFPGTRSTP